MDYEKLHKDTINKLQQMVNSGKITVETARGICADFVAESEDEKIRKGLIDYFSDFHLQTFAGLDPKKINAWLEKQGKQKPTIIIPKFRVGDEIKTTNETSLTITKIDEKGYWSESLFICSFDNADKWKLVEQKPAWSEEDEKLFNRICDLIHEAAYENCETNEDGKELGEYAKMMRLLKFLKERCHWKPSEEQLRELENVFSPDTCSWDEDVLRELHKQLKQL